MDLFKDVPRSTSPDYVKNKIKSIYEHMGLDKNDLSIQGVETTKIINGLDLPRPYHKRLMIKAKKEYFAEIADTLQSKPQETVPSPQVSDFSWLQKPTPGGFYTTWIQENIGKNHPVSKKEVDDFFETLEASFPAPPTATKRKKRPANVTESASKKKKMDVSPPPQVSQQDMAEQSQDAESWFSSIPAPPPKSDCAISLGSLAELLSIPDAMGSNSVNYDTIFDTIFD